MIGARGISLEGLLEGLESLPPVSPHLDTRTRSNAGRGRHRTAQGKYASTLPPPMVHAIACALVEGITRPDIIRRSGARLEQVRTIERHLRVLAESGTRGIPMSPLPTGTQRPRLIAQGSGSAGLLAATS